MRRWLGNVNANTVMAVSALVTSVVAVVVSWDEARLMRRSQEASFMPLMDVRATVSTAPDDLRVAIDVRNTGHGIAFVEAAEMASGEEVLSTYDAFAGAVLNEELGERADFSFTAVRGFFSPGEQRQIMRLEWDDTPENRALLEAFMREEATTNYDAMRLTLCYCSVFDKCFERTEGEGSPAAARPEPVAECEAGGDPIEAIWDSYTAARGAEEGGEDA